MTLKRTSVNRYSISLLVTFAEVDNYAKIKSLKTASKSICNKQLFETPAKLLY